MVRIHVTIVSQSDASCDAACATESIVVTLSHRKESEVDPTETPTRKNAQNEHPHFAF